MITVDGLTKRYGELVAVDDLSFTVEPGAETREPTGCGERRARRSGKERP